MNFNIKGKAIGLDLGGTNLHLGIFESEEMKDHWVIPFEHSDNLDTEVKNIASAIKEYLPKSKSYPFGMACAGFFNYKKKVITHGVNFPVVEDPRFFPKLAKALGYSKWDALNDADAAAIGASFLLRDSAFHITLGTGVGTGVVAHGTLQFLDNGYDIEYGHLELARVPKGRPCNCGSSFCIESYWGKVGLIETAHKKFPKLKEMKEAPDNLLEDEIFLEHKEVLRRLIRIVQVGFGTSYVSFSGGNSRFLTKKVQKEILETGIDSCPKPKIKVFTQHEKRMMGSLGAALYTLRG